MGSPKPVAAFGSAFDRFGKRGDIFNSFGPHNHRDFDVDDSAFASIKFDNGAIVNFECAWAINFPVQESQQLMLAGDRGGAQVFPPKLFYDDGSILLDVEPNPIGQLDYRQQHARGIETFVDAVIADSEVLVLPRASPRGHSDHRRHIRVDRNRPACPDRRLTRVARSGPAGVVLAAGAGARMGVPKALLDWGGRPLVAWQTAALLEGGAVRVVVVTGHQSDLVGAAVEGLANVEIAHNRNPDAGRASSVNLAARAVAGSSLAIFATSTSRSSQA